MTRLAVLAPVLRRPHRVEPLVASLAAAGPADVELVFIASPGDIAEHDEIDRVADVYRDRLAVRLVVIDELPGPGDYARKINAGYRATTAPLLFLAADDIAFRAGWFEAIERRLDGVVQVVGTNDLGNGQVMAGVHSTHTLVTRAYCDHYGTIDQPGLVLHEGYVHEYVDVELVETAKARRMWAHATDSIVEHLHPHWGKAPTDDLYDAHKQRMAAGQRLWRQRRQLVRALTREPQTAPAASAVKVTVITASLPARSSLLAEAAASVAAQTIPAAHLIGVDGGRGVAEVRNQLIGVADTEWVAFLDDDDLLDPHHLETLYAHAGDADVIIPHCRFDGPALPTPSCCAGYCNRPYDEHDLRQHGIFPITVLARRSAVLAAGGFTTTGWDDWNLWKAMADRGARFVVVPEITWTYRTSTADRRTHKLQGAAA